MNTGPLILMDFNNAAWRAAFALRNAGLSSDGSPTAVLYGLLGEVSKVMGQFRSNRVIMCADSPEGDLKRAQLYPEYKASRTAKMTEADVRFRAGVRAGMITARQLLKDAGFSCYFHKTGYEADDLIAAFASAAPDEEKVVVSTDRDLYQLLGPTTELWRPGVKDRRVTLQTFHAVHGISPSDWATVKAISGCSTDNVPGAYRVGEITAIKFLLGKIKAGATLDRLTEFKQSANFTRNMRLVKLPFDDKVVRAAAAALSDRTVRLPEAVWDSVCRAAGIKTIPYPL